MPVSYTHLDVYKRQDLNGQADALHEQIRILEQNLEIELIYHGIPHNQCVSIRKIRRMPGDEGSPAGHHSF